MSQDSEFEATLAQLKPDDKFSVQTGIADPRPVRDCYRVVEVDHAARRVVGQLEQCLVGEDEDCEELALDEQDRLTGVRTFSFDELHEVLIHQR